MEILPVSTTVQLLYEKMLDGKYTKKVGAVLDKSWNKYP